VVTGRVSAAIDRASVAIDPELVVIAQVAATDLELVIVPELAIDRSSVAIGRIDPVLAMALATAISTSATV
jgi:hypothetical protein